MHAPQLQTGEIVSTIDGQARQHYVYTPRGYSSSTHSKWPVLFFLHGDGERGDGQKELPYVLKHGPLYEAWIQQQDLPFIIVSPQLPMFGRDLRGIAHLNDRPPMHVPQPGATAPHRVPATLSSRAIKRGMSVREQRHLAALLPEGWDCVEQDLLTVMSEVRNNYRVDTKRCYLTGLSYGGFGTWHLAARHPQLFAAIAPVCGWLHPQHVPALAEAKIPIWTFAGGRDSVITIENFYLGMEMLRLEGHTHARFTVHEDMEHDVWRRVYQSSDLYQWLLSNTRA